MDIILPKYDLRTLRQPVIGDKFSSDMDKRVQLEILFQKKICHLLRMDLKPDIIINPHAIPSRMTIGQLKETLLGKVLIRIRFIW